MMPLGEDRFLFQWRAVSFRGGYKIQKRILYGQSSASHEVRSGASIRWESQRRTVPRKMVPSTHVKRSFWFFGLADREIYTLPGTNISHLRKARKSSTHRLKKCVGKGICMDMFVPFASPGATCLLGKKPQFLDMMNISIPGQRGNLSQLGSQPGNPSSPHDRLFESLPSRAGGPPGRSSHGWNPCPSWEREGRFLPIKTTSLGQVQCGFNIFLNFCRRFIQQHLIHSHSLIIGGFIPFWSWYLSIFWVQKTMVSIQPIRLDVTSISGNLRNLYGFFHHPVGIPIGLIALIWNADGLDGHFSAGL